MLSHCSFTLCVWDLSPLSRRGVLEYQGHTHFKPTVLESRAECPFFTRWEGGKKKIPQAKQKTLLKIVK